MIKAVLLCLLLVGFGLLMWKGWAGMAEQPRVMDRAGLFTPEQLGRLDDYHRALLQAYDIDYRVVTDNAVQAIDHYANQTFEKLRVGEMSRAGHGLLLVVSPQGDKVRLEVGRSLEGVFPDAFIAYIEARQMAPFFRVSRVADGIIATTELIVGRAQDDSQGMAYAAPAGGFEASTGAGAEVRAAIGEGALPEDFSRHADVAAGNAPAAALQNYLSVLESDNARPDLNLYSAASREFMKNWTSTPAQRKNEARTLRQCGAFDVMQAGERAVVRFAIDKNTCPPYFFIHEDDAWRVDLASMSQVIRFNFKNHWHLNYHAANPYAFAFDDWHLDERGFPLHVH